MKTWRPFPERKEGENLVSTGDCPAVPKKEKYLCI